MCSLKKGIFIFCPRRDFASHKKSKLLWVAQWKSGILLIPIFQSHWTLQPYSVSQSFKYKYLQNLNKTLDIYH